MKKKAKTILFVFIIIGVVILNFTYKNKNEETKTKQRKQNNLAIMIKGDSGEYVSSNEIPKGNYVLNEEKTHCENNGKVISYDNTTGKIGFSFIGSDRCYLFFEVVTDTEKPVISNLTINGKTISATLTDNEGLLAYGFSTSNLTEPTSWTTISGKTYNLNTTINTEGTYYLWVKDGAGNKAVSNVIDLEKKGWQTILANNTVNEATPDFSKVATTNEGLFKADDDYTATTGMKSYYFRGAVDNNWVKYGKYTKDMYNCNNGTISATDTGNSCTKIASSGDDIYWRIIRINGDGSIRMIYSGVTPPTESTKIIKTTDTSLGNIPFNQNYNSAEYVGYMYTIGEQHGTSKSSDIKTYLDNWYANYTDLNKTGTKITDQIYCNDRTASTSNVAYSTTNYTTLTSWNSTGTTYYYGANGRVWNDPVSPDYKCPVASDKFTTTTAIGNGKLTYPVGLITADEITFAGLPAGKTNNSFYLYTGAYYWAGSPSGFFYSLSIEFDVFDDGFLSNDNVASNIGVRGVVSLSSESKLLGSGTYNDVYTVN